MPQKFLTIINGVKTLVELDIATPKTVGEIFNSIIYTPISPSFPSVCISRLHESDSKTVIIDSSNLPDLVPLLRAKKWKFQNSENIEYTSFVPGVTTEISLFGTNSATVNQPLFELLTEMLYYHNSKDKAIALDNTDYSELNLVVSFNNVKSKIIGFNAITETLSIDYDSSALSTSSGNIQIFPHCIGDSETGFATKAQLRKLKPETTLASGFQEGSLLGHRFQRHFHDFYYIGLVGEVGGNLNGFGVGSPNNILSPINDNVKAPKTDGINGTPQTGKSTRSNQFETLVYIYGGSYAN